MNNNTNTGGFEEVNTAIQYPKVKLSNGTIYSATGYTKDKIKTIAIQIHKLN
jgi:hypothetical protein